MINPFFSVITPNYNSGDKLLRAARSLLDNKTSYEHIIVDDCSVDDSFILPPEMSPFSTVVRNSINLGPGPSRNKGLDIAKGRYVIFLDSDDFFVPRALDVIYQLVIAQGQPDVMAFGYSLVRSENELLLKRQPASSTADVKDLSRNSLLRKYFLDEIVSAPWGKCISSNVAKMSRFPSLRMAEDSFYNLDVFIRAETAIICSSKLYVFDKTDSNSLTSKIFNYREFEKLYEAWLAFERRVLNDTDLDGYENLVYTRKIKFCVLYPMSRLSLTPDWQWDDRVVNIVKSIFLKNAWSARKHLSLKAGVAACAFCVMPKTTLRILRNKIKK